MDNLLALDRIILDKIEKGKRINELYGRLSVAMKLMVEWGTFERPMPEESSQLWDRIIGYKAELYEMGEPEEYLDNLTYYQDVERWLRS